MYLKIPPNPFKVVIQIRGVISRQRRFKYGKEACLAMALMEHLGHRQSGEIFAKVLRLFHEEADKVHGDPDNPCPMQLYPSLIVQVNCRMDGLLRFELMGRSQTGSW